jgi:RNA polymerase sigma-70 factor (ECF subfamily)
MRAYILSSLLPRPRITAPAAASMVAVYGLPKRDPPDRPERVRDEGSVEITERLRAGDGSALLELFQREGKRAFALAYRVVGDAATAEDAVQEAFAQLWQRAPRLDPQGGRIEALLMTIVHRRAVDMVRKTERGPTSLPNPELLEQIDDQATEMLERVEEALSSEGLRARLRAAVAALPPEQRAVLDHIYVWQHSLREIAELECLPVGTVKSRLRLAMAKLTGALRDQERP